MFKNDTYSTPLLVVRQAAFKTWVRSEEFSRLMRKTGIVSSNKFDGLIVHCSSVYHRLRCKGKKHSTTGNVISLQETIRNDEKAQLSTNSKSPVVPSSLLWTNFDCRRWLFRKLVFRIVISEGQYVSYLRADSIHLRNGKQYIHIRNRMVCTNYWGTCCQQLARAAPNPSICIPCTGIISQDKDSQKPSPLLMGIFKKYNTKRASEQHVHSVRICYTSSIRLIGKHPTEKTRYSEMSQKANMI